MTSLQSSTCTILSGCSAVLLLWLDIICAQINVTVFHMHMSTCRMPLQNLTFTHVAKPCTHADRNLPEHAKLAGKRRRLT